MYSLLADRYCRDALAYFSASSSDVASVSDIADAISDPGDEERTRLRLHHYALPRLDGADVVDYDPRSNTVRYRDHPDLDLLKRSIDRL